MNETFAHRLAHRALRARAAGDAVEAAFTHELETRPAEVAFNLGEELPEPPEGVSAVGVRRFRGRVVRASRDGVEVRLGEIPSGRALQATLPREWFDEEGVAARPRRPIALVTWEDGSGRSADTCHRLIDEG